MISIEIIATLLDPVFLGQLFQQELLLSVVQDLKAGLDHSAPLLVHGVFQHVALDFFENDGVVWLVSSSFL